MKKAFTLIEVLVALAVLSIAVVGLLTAYRTSLVHQHRAWARGVAAQWADEKLAEVAALGKPDSLSGERQVDGLSLRWFTENRQVEKGLEEWAVTVRWEEAGKKDEVRFVTWRREKEDEKK